MTVAGTIKTVSNSPEEGGIVLVAAGTLAMDSGSRMITQTTILANAQQVNFIGDELNRLHGTVYDAGGGIGGDRTTTFVLRNAGDRPGPTGFIGEIEPTRLVLQRVVMQFGDPLERGFSVYVGYADNFVQEFDRTGELGRPVDRSSTVGSIPSVDSGSVATFTRATSFENTFLASHPILETFVVIRRSDDFFLFQNAATQVEDMTYEFHKVNGVRTDGTAGATEMPMDPEPIKLGMPVSVTTPVLIQPIQQPNNTLPELPQILPKPIEVAVYRVSFNDSNDNGQAEQSELPKTKDVEGAEDVELDKFDEELVKNGKFQRYKIDQLKSESGGTASPQDIDNFKAKFLNDPEQTSGAYSIIQKDGDKTTVLETFSLRDWPEQEPVNQPVVQPEGSMPVAPEAKDAPAVEPKADNDQLPPPVVNPENPETSSWTPGRGPGKWETRLASSGFLMGALLMIRNHGRQTPNNLLDTIVENQQDANKTSHSFSSRARRSRRYGDK